MSRRHYRRYRRNARPGENEIPTVRIVRRRNPKRRHGKRRTARRSSPGAAASRLAFWRWHHNPGHLTAVQRTALRRLLKSNPRKHGKRRGKKRSMARRHRRVRKARHSVRRRKLPKPPKGKRVGSVFKRKGKWFRVGKVKVRRGRRKVSRRVVRKISARAAHRARK